MPWDFIGNELYKKDLSTWTKIFAQPIEDEEDSTSMILKGNGLSQKKPDELATCLAIIPPKINTLDISDNGFTPKTTTSEALAKIYAAFPPHLNALTCSLSDLFERPIAELILLGQSMPFMKELHVVNEKGSKVFDSSVDIVRKHMGASFREADEAQQALHKIFDKNLLSLILSYITKHDGLFCQNPKAQEGNVGVGNSLNCFAP